MFREIRIKNRQLTEKDCHEILNTAEYGTLATMGDDGYPYAVPVNFIYHNGNIYFHCAVTGHMLENIHHCPNVSFNVVKDVFAVPILSESKFKRFDTNYNSVTVFGTAVEVFAEEKQEGLQVFLKKFLSEDAYQIHQEAGMNYIEKSLKRTKLIKIEILHMTGKRGNM
ncbi:MAG: pyridoxamine 5'-phosphate oxidase family protein [Proteobacteria bacterium]|nr:pyridoxamine 5'-phosphate oxidase family protein [Pseudomonadota bacterium]MBU1387551.1 pyridoxamine 5'-phosphate oxidase family protein [Pseudomonadota bacterium]MBU1544026.1 pyridoxamine 5'-phosphate oxidase family protein [Pseudomonadota bacterium]MBU2479748.1 pyridoxamine 5'-phosphate oxidase family protein [Pseudomonadota bacterium]